MRKGIYFLFMIVVLTSCIKEKYTTIQSFLINNTIYTIKILPYKSGAVDVGDTIKILPNQSFKFGYNHSRGLTGQGIMYSDYWDSDSMLVFFNDSFKVVHYFGETPTNPPAKYLPKTSNRNLFNYLSFGYEQEDKSKYSRINTYTYRFEESDYEFAKN